MADKRIKISSIRIKNFRSIRNELIQPKDFNIFVGLNDAGKRRGKITEYEHDILQMRSKGKTYREIHQYIKEKGYTGTTAAIRVYMQKERAHARTSGG